MGRGKGKGKVPGGVISVATASARKVVWFSVCGQGLLAFMC